MRKIVILFVATILFLGAYNVKAKDTCDFSKIEVKDVSVKEKSDNTIELSDAIFKDNKLNVDLKMFDVGDYIEYKILFKNTSSEEYYFDSKMLNIDSTYFDYSVSYPDNSNKIEANKEKNILIKIKYKKEVEEDKFYGAKYIDKRNVVLNLSNKNIFFTNPLTGGNIIILIFIVYLLIIGTLFYFFRFKKSKISLLLMVGFTILLPIHVMAICKYSIDIDTNIVVGKVKPHPCYFDGELIQGAEFTDGNFIYRYKQEWAEDDNDYYKSLWKNIDEDGWGVVYKDADTNIDGEIIPIMCSSINDKPIVSLSRTFFTMFNLNKIDVSNIDTSKVVNMREVFFELGVNVGYMEPENSSVEIVGLDNWDTSNVKDLFAAFESVGRSAVNIKISDISNWDVSKVENMGEMFMFTGRGHLSEKWSSDYTEFSNFNYGDISNWNVSNVKDMSSMFYFFDSSSKNVKMDFSKWNVSNVENMDYMFEGFGEYSENISLNGLNNWNVSKVKSMSSMFWYFGPSAKKVDIGDLSNWDVSNVENMSYMFGCYGSGAKKVDFFDISNWNTKKVKYMNWMFDGFAEKSETTVDIGTLNVYSAEIKEIFYNSKNIKATMNLYSNPIYYEIRYGSRSFLPFIDAATNPNALITVNYSRNTTDIDDIIASKSENSNVVKGRLLD